MALYDRILVPTDGSTEGETAVAHAIDLAAAHDATVSAVYVINSASYIGLPVESSWDGITEMLQTDARAAVESVEALGEQRGVPVETTIVEGSPSKEIVRTAESEDCDLIVMGTHGRGGIDRLLLGSVAEKVVRGSHIPVLTVRVGDELAFAEEAANTDADTNANSDVEANAEADGAMHADSQTG